MCCFLKTLLNLRCFIETYFRIIKPKVLCSNSSFQRICNFGFENQVVSDACKRRYALKCTNVFILHRFLSLQNFHLMFELGVLVTCHLVSFI